MAKVFVNNLPTLEVEASLYRGDDQAIRVALTENGQPLSDAMRAAMGDPGVRWKSDVRPRADSALLFSVQHVTFDAATDTVLLDLTSAETSKLIPSCVADLQVSWPDNTGRIRTRTLAVFTIATTRDVTHA